MSAPLLHRLVSCWDCVVLRDDFFLSFLVLLFDLPSTIFILLPPFIQSKLMFYSLSRYSVEDSFNLNFGDSGEGFFLFLFFLSGWFFLNQKEYDTLRR